MSEPVDNTASATEVSGSYASKEAQDRAEEQAYRDAYVARENRVAALHLAVDVAKINGTSTDHKSVLATAKAFEKFLKG